MASICRRTVEIAQSTFGPGGQHRPQPWPPLSPKYQKRINYFGPPKLILTGALQDSIKTGYVTETTGVVMAGDGRSADYASAHQFGQSPVPARPYLPIQFGGIGTGDKLTPYAESEIQKTIDAEVTRITSSKS